MAHIFRRFLHQWGNESRLADNYPSTVQAIPLQAEYDEE